MNALDSTLIGQAPEFLAVVRAARIVAATDVALLILGESGTGKELLARTVHDHSRRAQRPFVTVNCAALPESLAEAELFGHRRGAFTGASGDSPGRIRAAAGGTLLLDEVGELPLSLQAKLLRFLESGECQALGQPLPERVDVRILAATNRDLLAEVRAGRFREDLYYRLNVVPLELPPLRQRRDDLEPLIGHHIDRLARQHGLTPPRFSAAALAALKRYAWPGNVRELRNLCERMVVLLSGCEITPGNLPREIQCPDRPQEGGLFSLPDGGVSLTDLEAGLLRQALDRTQGNRSRAARLLGLSRDTFLYRLKKYAIEA